MNSLYYIFSFIFGTIIGSFLNVVILRLPHNQKLNGRSHCNSCHHLLGALDLVPVLSYLMLGGRCRYCKAKISPRYFLIELILGSLFAITWWILNPATPYQFLELFRFCFFEAVLLVIFVIDLEHFLILDNVLLPAGVVAVFVNIGLDVLNRQPILSFHSQSFLGLISALVFSGVFFSVWYLSKGLWMGFGDVKLMLLLGLALGWPLTAVGLMLGVVFGGVVSVFLLIFAGKTLKSRLPFGTFLAVGAILALFYGEKLLAWYLAFLGF